MNTGAAVGPSTGAATGSDTRRGHEPADATWRVRTATHEDVGQVAVAVAELLVELGGTPPATAKMQATTRALIEDRDAGALIVAEAEGTLMGVLAASWQLAIHAGGSYGLIQDLWVHPAWRGKAVGSALLVGLSRRAKELGIMRVEVGLPREQFAGLESTEAFYRRNGFTSLGTRMRLLLA
jgi:GNAT superfamily N-acetyltransferase